MADATQVGFRTVDRVRVRCAESTGTSSPSILLTSPWPESVYAFVPVWPSLANVARLVAVDFPGFGRSERRDDRLSPGARGATGTACRRTGHLLRDIVGFLFASAAGDPVIGRRHHPSEES